MNPNCFSITIFHDHSVSRTYHHQDYTYHHQDYSPTADLLLSPTTISSVPPYLSYHLTFYSSSIQAFNQFQSTMQSHLTLFSISPWFQSPAEPSESLLIITLTYLSSPLIMPTIRFIQGVNMQEPGGCGAFGNDTYSQLAMVSTGNQLHLWIFLNSCSASKRRNLKSVLASISVSGVVVTFHDVGMYSTSGKSTMYIYLFINKYRLIEFSIWRSFSGSALARN